MSKNIIILLKIYLVLKSDKCIQTQELRTKLTLNTLTWQPELCIGRTSVDELGGKESTCNLNGTPLSPPQLIIKQ